ncbi:MAG: tetratricopeptide repeat protein [Deltaproteobacteria bacterium]|nr:MAG: tetratricopeptide repeat protein [Deltaproteobacteria bacterium]
MTIRTLGLVALGCFLLQGCVKPTQVRVKTAKKQVLSMGPMVFVAKKGKVIHIEHYSDEQLFDKGGQAYRAGKFAEAKRYYLRLVNYKPKSEYVADTLYNLGLALEKLDDFQLAAKMYKRLLARNLDQKTRRDTEFRLGGALSATKQWKEAETLYTRLKAYKGLMTPDRIEVMTRLAVALQEQEKHNQALLLFHDATRLYRRASKKEFLGKDYFTAMAHFRIGHFYEQRFRKRLFRKTIDDMKQDLQSKAQDLLTAQAHYMRSMRVGNSHWLVASLYRVGGMYQQMYKDMMNAPLPNLSKEENSVYQCMLKKKIRILLTKAVYAYERNIQAAQVLNVQDSDWIQKTKKQLVELRQRIVQDYYSESASACSEPKAKPEDSSKAKAPAKTSGAKKRSS